MVNENDAISHDEASIDLMVDATPADATDEQGRHRRTMTGVVVSTKMDKTAVIAVTRVFLHPKYRKYVRRRKKYMAHDEHSKCAMGDQVVIEECRPMSRHKRWVYKTTLRSKEG
jgi:small subunit ribosomal protein S17